jgi:hypothetical protein
MIEPGRLAPSPIVMLDETAEPGGAAGSVGRRPPTAVDDDPGAVVLTCANCGAAMDERKCKLICRCGYFLSCSDYD